MNKLPRGLSFVALCGASVILWMRPLLDTFALAAHDDKYTHIFLIVPLAVALIVQGWRERAYEPQFWTPAAGLLVVPLIMLAAVRWGHWGGTSDVSLAIEMKALVLWWIASFLLCFGLPAMRSFRFPLLFLFAVVPMPAILLDRIVASLQHGTILVGQSLFWLFRVSAVQQGITLQIPGLDIEVTPDCSSIRSSLMLLVTTMVLAHLLLGTTWHKILAVVVALPLSIAKNGLRIFTIGMLATHVDPSYLTGRLHRQGGIVFFLIALALIFLLLWMLRKRESSLASTPPS